jgi:hypothetical protein
MTQSGTTHCRTPAYFATLYLWILEKTRDHRGRHATCDCDIHMAQTIVTLKIARGRTTRRRLEPCDSRTCAWR